MSSLNSLGRPPESLRTYYKSYQKSSTLDGRKDLLDTGSLTIDGFPNSLSLMKNLPTELFQSIFHDFLGKDEPVELKQTLRDVPMFELKALPGLLIAPSLLPPIVQLRLLDCLMHRDLSNPVHNTNVHLHHALTYPATLGTGDPRHRSFFTEAFDHVFTPKDPSVHKDMTIKDFLNRRLRWITLGGQYDWTNKVYPAESPPQFPQDIAQLLQSLLPEMTAEAAIVNLYSPGDTLSLHQDVSERTDRSLISISMGCEAIFVIGNDDGHAIKLQSGDAIFMTKESRFAWHGVPKVLARTCPPWMEDWPATEGREEYANWRGFMSNKRVNLNVRQIDETC